MFMLAPGSLELVADLEKLSLMLDIICISIDLVVLPSPIRKQMMLIIATNRIADPDMLTANG